MGKKGKSICLFSSKGGTGKSSIATLLSGFFAMQDKKVLIIDFDLSFGSIGLLLNKESNKNIITRYIFYQISSKISCRQATKNITYNLQPLN